ncbi:TspO/MBR family protein [Micrococcus sp.]|uniref:TspO/MBR family protein n=1 Tax=Micrococcus sp. TaxID=1271 RepID=UPI0026DC0AEA|nr:TspO/MBR family protein [Micrococcus sp.]MDO4239756.1 TspO/MBR family protein [Micrococcus sp.]
MTFKDNLIQSALAVGATAVVGTIATKPDSRWYKSLRKPEIQPPAAVFPIAWTALYGTIIGASARALTAGERIADPGPEDSMPTPREHTQAVQRVRNYRRALGANLVLNAGWSALFFRGKNMKVAAAEAALLAASSWDLARRAGQLDPASGALLVPYAGWCTFATVLSARIDAVN